MGPMLGIKKKADPKGPQLVPNLHAVDGMIRYYIDKNSLFGRGCIENL
jgi:hypothetical protein